MAYLSKGLWNLALQPRRTLYLHFDNAFGNQTQQGGNFYCVAPGTHNVTGQFDYVLLRAYVTN